MAPSKKTLLEQGYDAYINLQLLEEHFSWPNSGFKRSRKAETDYIFRSLKAYFNKVTKNEEPQYVSIDTLWYRIHLMQQDFRKENDLRILRERLTEIMRVVRNARDIAWGYSKPKTHNPVFAEIKLARTI